MGAPVTLSLVALITLLSVLLSDFDASSCPAATLKDFDAKQWILSLFNYAGTGRLAYDMASLLWKGAILEASIGSRRFGYTLLQLLLICDGLLIMTGGAMIVWGAPQVYPSISEARLSGLLFALNSVLNSSIGVHGFLPPMHYRSLCRAIIETNTAVELFVVRNLFPGAPFSGPVCGTLAGLLYCHASKLCICRNPHPCGMFDKRELTWMCQSCHSENGVYLLSCPRCGEHRLYN